MNTVHHQRPYQAAPAYVALGHAPAAQNRLWSISGTGYAVPAVPRRAAAPQPCGHSAPVYAGQSGAISALLAFAAHDGIRVSFDFGASPGPRKIELCDLTGYVLHSAQNVPYSGSICISSSGLCAGAYAVRMKQDEDILHTATIKVGR